MTRHTFVVHVEDKPGVLNRVASLFRRRAFNIESLTVGHTEVAGVSRMTIVVDTDTNGARRIEANLYNETRTHIMQLVDTFRARVVDVAPDSLIIEATGTEEKIDGLMGVLEPYGVLEMVRTGRVAMSRGRQSTTPEPAAADTETDDNVSYSV